MPDRDELARRTPGVVMLGDFTIYGKRWCCRWCRAKADTIREIEHQPWCELATWCARCAKC